MELKENRDVVRIWQFRNYSEFGFYIWGL